MLPYHFSAKVEQEDLRRFNFYSYYHRPTGVMMILIGILMFGATQWLFVNGRIEPKDEVMMTLISLVVILYLPLTLVMRAKGALLRNPVFSEPLHYSLEEKGLLLSTNVDLGEGVSKQSELHWNNVYKAVRTKHELLIFSNQVNAFVIPMREIRDEYPVIRQILDQKLKPHQKGRL